MSAEYSEDILIQQTTADYFKNVLGWETIYGYDQEKLAENGTFGRLNQTEVILTRFLVKALQKLNPNHPDQAYHDAINTLKEVSSSKTLLQHNQEKYQLIRDGIRVNYTTAEGEKKEPLLQLIDFKNPENNHFLIVRELWIQGKIYRRRPDLIGFINGIPLLFIELKKSCRDVKIAYNDNYRDYKDTIPELFYYNAIIMLSNGIDCRAGSITSPFDFFHQWKRLTEKSIPPNPDLRGFIPPNPPWKGGNVKETTPPFVRGAGGDRVSWETMLKGICQPENFLDLIENFVLFDAGGKQGTIKIFARNHQYLGVNQAFKAVVKRNQSLEPQKLGVFWHTQGSGKSYSMAFLSEKIHRKLTGSYTFLIVTDRVELDRQISSTFASLGINDEKTQATNGEHLKQLLTENHRYVFTLIHKFNQVGVIYSERKDIIVICDEAHRTQYGLLADNMRYGLPNAGFIAFTGTPLMDSEEDQLTRQTFGGYVSEYNFQQAIADGATVPLYYDNRGEKLIFEYEGKEISVANDESLNQKIAQELSNYNLDQDDEKAILRRLGKDYVILTAQDRLERIAEDLVAHYTQRWQTGKAMLVCLDKLTAVKMHDLIEQYWKQAIFKQKQRLQQATDDQDQIEQQQYLDWLEETEYLVIISESQNEIKTFRDFGLEIEPHRVKMKQRNLDEEFKDPNHPFRLAIVCAMWLTGFDVKSLSTLYIDKPMKGHSLMQTIARANRVCEGKDNGLLVDYNGLLKSLRSALSKYAQGDSLNLEQTSDDDSLYPDVQSKLRAEYELTIVECINHVNNLGCNLQGLIEATGFDKLALLDGNNKDSILNAICTNDETKAKFEVLARNVFVKNKSLKGYDPITRDYQAQYNAIDAIYKQLHQTQAQNENLNLVLRSLQETIGKSIKVMREREAGGASGNIYDLSQIDWDLLKAEFAQSTTKNQQVQALKDALKKQLERMLQQNQSQIRLNLDSRYQQIINDYNRETDRVAIEQTFEELMHLVVDLNVEDHRAIREGLNEEDLAIFDLLSQNKENLSSIARNQVKKVAQALLEQIKTLLGAIENWQEKESTQAQVRQLIHNYLYDEKTGLPEDYETEEIEEYSKVVYLHIYKQYGRANFIDDREVA